LRFRSSHRDVPRALANFGIGPLAIRLSRKLSLRLRAGRFPTRHDQLRQQDLDGLAALDARFAAHSRHPAIGPRARRDDLLDFAYDLDDIARPGWLRRADPAAVADDPNHEWQSRLDQQAHGDRRR